MAFCRGCGAEIEFMRTQKGKYMPVDPEPVFVITGDGGTDAFFTEEEGVITGRRARPGEVVTQEQRMNTPVGFVPHWKTCPQAGEFRSRR